MSLINYKWVASQQCIKFQELHEEGKGAKLARPSITRKTPAKG